MTPGERKLGFFERCPLHEKACRLALHEVLRCPDVLGVGQREGGDAANWFRGTGRRGHPQTGFRGSVLAPETVAYLAEKVNRAMTRKTMPSDALRKQRQAELDQAQEELEHIKSAIRQGAITATT